ncbi:MAG: hypothetical protein WAL80_25950 [Xanthobacteraceae bacterium]
MIMEKVSSRNAALILLYAIEERGDRRGKEITRARLSRMTLKRLWNRESLTDPWLAEVNEWLLSAGWTLLHAGSTFGVVRTSVVENWPRIASKRIQEVLDQVARGNFDFSKIEHLLEPVSLDDSASSASSQKRSPRTRRST